MPSNIHHSLHFFQTKENFCSPFRISHSLQFAFHLIILHGNLKVFPLQLLVLLSTPNSKLNAIKYIQTTVRLKKQQNFKENDKSNGYVQHNYLFDSCLIIKLDCPISHLNMGLNKNNSNVNYSLSFRPADPVKLSKEVKL